jgi:hypothetical protein
METDWTSLMLRAAAVEYALDACGRRPGGKTDQSDWMRKVERVAEQFKCRAEDLLVWMADKDLQPEPRYSVAPRAETLSVEDDAALIDAAAAKAPAVPEGALPAAVRDPVASLIEKEKGALSASEREEIATALDADHSLKPEQRAALARLLRGSEFASVRDVLRATLDFLIPFGSEARRAFRRQSTWIRTLPPRCTFEYVELSRVITGFSLSGRSLLVIRDAEQTICRLVPYARVKSCQSLPDRTVLYLCRLVPAERFASELVSKKVAFLAEYAREENARDGNGWAELFGQTKANVSVLRKGLAAKICTATGARNSGYRALRAKPQRNKGTKKKATK